MSDRSTIADDRRARIARVGFALLILGLSVLALHAAGKAEPRAGWLDGARPPAAARP